MDFLLIIEEYSRQLEILGFCIGVLYLWWEYHANAKVWIASVIMPAINMWVYYYKGLYADFAINIYYLLIAVYGYLAWTFSFTQKKQLEITHAGTAVAVRLAMSFILLWTGIAALLIYCTDSTVPWTDAFTTALSIVGLWMLARKYVEQWLVWMVVDAVCVWLYVYKGLYLYAVLYAVYTVIAILGYRKWIRIMNKRQ